MRRRRRLLLALSLLALAFIASHVITGPDGDMLAALPGLVLLVFLLSGRYVGEQRIARLAARLLPARLRDARRIAVAPRRAPRALPRGGGLIAAALATRGPPPAATAR